MGPYHLFELVEHVQEAEVLVSKLKGLYRKGLLHYHTANLGYAAPGSGSLRKIPVTYISESQRTPPLLDRKGLQLVVRRPGSSPSGGKGTQGKAEHPGSSPPMAFPLGQRSGLLLQKIVLRSS
jgi:hypothetical protein